MNNPFAKLKDIVGKNKEENMEPNDIANENEPEKKEERVVGKIIKLHPDGWGFISSKEIKFTRIFFHWSSLNHKTKNFTELKVGMKLEFTPLRTEKDGVRAIKIQVLD